MKNFYFNNILYNSLASMVSVFDDMSVWVYDADGRATRSKKVPVIIAPKEKVVSALMKGNFEVAPSNQGVTIENYLPQISVFWNNLSLDTERLAGQRNQRRLYTEESDRNEDGCEESYVHTDIKTVPYKMGFEVTLWTKYESDMAQLLENILPFFHPEAYVSIYEKGVGLERQCKVTKESESLNFTYDLNQPDRRVLQSTLTFSMEINFYKPENPITKPIQKMYLNIAQPKENGKADGEKVIVEAASEPGICFHDLDSKTRSFIKEFNLEDQIYTSQYYPDVNGIVPQPKEMLPTHLPREFIDTLLRRDPNYGVQDIINVVTTEVTSDELLVTNMNVKKSSIISSYVVTPNGFPPLTSSISRVDTGNFTIKLSEVPTSNLYKVVYRIEPIGDLIVNIPIGSNTVTIVNDRIKATSIPVVQIYNTTEAPNIAIDGILSISDGSFSIRLSSTPAVDGYKLTWSVETA
jgi:hypothetical protein